jgi:hypothetical protein
LAARLPLLLPFALSLLLALVTLAWNGVVGLSWNGPTLWTILLASAPLLLLAAYAALRGMNGFAEAIVFACAYMLVPLIAVRLSYLVTTVDFPLVDTRLAGFDHALGFDWGNWARFLGGHPWLHTLTFAAYMSPIEQALCSAAIFSFAGLSSRNAEMLFSLVLALIVVIAIYTLLPELGPASLIGAHNQMEASIIALRAGSLGPFPYVGVVSFPSFHTIMAIVFTFSHRGLRSFWPVAMLNTLMLLGTPTYGDHYLADMFAGAAVAACTLLVSHLIYGRREAAAHIGRTAPAWEPAPAG